MNNRNITNDCERHNKIITYESGGVKYKTTLAPAELNPRFIELVKYISEVENETNKRLKDLFNGCKK